MRTGLWLLCGVLTSGVVVLLFSAGDARGALSAQDAWKARHAANVVAELRARDTADLTDAQRRNRMHLLDELLRYGEAGRFAQNEEFPGEAIPHLIDRHGTRCALANLIDRSGDGALLQRLAAQDNTAFVPALKGDPGLGAWLDEHGFTIEEAAYIQGPGFVDSGAGSNVESPAEPDASSTGTEPAASSSGGRGWVGSGRGEATWDMWWRLNRHAFINLRERYHLSFVVTGKVEDAAGRRPNEDQIDETVIPLLRELAKGGNTRVRSTALMAWARVARPRHAPEVIEALRAYLRDLDNPYQELMILALGVLHHPDTLEDLAAIALNTKEGRKVLGKSEGITLQTRAYAAIALGQCGQPGAVDPLIEILDEREKKVVDLKACAVMSLGTLARQLEEKDRERIVKYLLKALKRESWGNAALALIPTAIANTGDEESFIKTFRPMIERFRRPTWARQSSLLGLAVLAPKADKRMLDMLIATARRDPDNNARRFGIMAIGELAYAQPIAPADEGDDGPRAKLGARIKTYFRSAFNRRSVQKVDLPWLVLSAALFARGFPEHKEYVRDQLLEHATGSGTKERQAASVIALGLLGCEDVLPRLRKLYADAKDKLVRSYLAEALGMLGDQTQRESLFERLREDGDGQLRYRAALGLGFSADSTILGPLVDALATTGSADARTALSRVVGELGDRRALPKLIEVAADKKAGVWNRVRAVGAIGLIGQEKDDAWVTAFKRGANWPQATPTLRAIFGLF
jgi:HEAT repeat protein